MLKDCIEYMNVVLEATDYFKKCYGLVVLVRKKEGDVVNEFPAEYAGLGEYNPVTNFDQENGSIYWRLTGDIKDTELYVNTQAARVIQRTYPLRMIYVAKRSQLGENDNAYSEDKMSIYLLKVMKGREKVMRETVGAKQITFIPNSSDFNGYSVAESEFINIEYNNRSSYMIGSIEFDLQVTISKDCVDDFSISDTDINAVIRGNVITEITTNTAIVTAAQVSEIEDAFCTISPCPPTTEVLATADLDVVENSDALLTNPDTAAFIDANKICDTTEEVLAVADLDVTANSDALLSNPDTAAFIDANKTCPTPLNTANPTKTGQVTSYDTGDDGDLEEGRLTDFTTLDFTNVFGDTNRFTDEFGTQIYISGIVIDWSTYNQNLKTVIGWDNNYLVSNNWADSLVAGIALSVGTFTSGWRMPNVHEIMIACDASNTAGFNYAPFNINPARLWTSTTQSSSTGNALRWLPPMLIAARGKTDAVMNCMFCRNFTWNGSSLT